MHEYYPSLLFLHLTSADLIACKGDPGTHMAVEHRGWRSVAERGGNQPTFCTPEEKWNQG